MKNALLTEKTKQITFGISRIQEILRMLRPEKVWRIGYCSTIPENITLWDAEYHGLIKGEEYIFIYEDDHLLYAVNVTGDSVLMALTELMQKLTDKF